MATTTRVPGGLDDGATAARESHGQGKNDDVSDLHARPSLKLARIVLECEKK